MSRLPDFIIIGAMKSATSTLHDQLARQPGFFLTTPKEPCFFSDDAVWARGEGWYRALFEDAPDGAICGESSTHYTKRPTHRATVGRMHALLPDVKLVYVMRHPVDRLLSHFAHEWSERTLAGPIDAAVHSAPRLVDYGRYAYQLDAFFEVYPRASVLPVFFERLVSRRDEELERVCRFLGAPRSGGWQADVSRQNVSGERLRRSPLRDLLVDTPGLRELRRALVPQALRDRVKGWWQLGDAPQLSASVREEVVRTFDEDLARLGEWLGVSLCCETFGDTVSAAPLEWVDAGGAPR